MAGTQATVRVDGHTRRGDVTIEIPPRSDLHVRMLAGDLRIDSIEGNKDIALTAGDLQIIATPEKYSQVDASVTFGDLNARSFRVSKGGIARSFAWQGSGSYKLRATSSPVT